MMKALGALGLVLFIAAPAFAQSPPPPQTFSRASTPPHVPSLVAAISPSLVAGSLHVTVLANGANYTVIIGAGSWNGVSLSAVQAQVDAAPADTVAVQAKYERTQLVGYIKCLLQANRIVAFDENNVTRANIAAASLAPRTLAQLDAAVDAKIDALGCQ